MSLLHENMSRLLHKLAEFYLTKGKVPVCYRRTGRRIIDIGVGITPDYVIGQGLYPKLGFVPDGTGIHEDHWGSCLSSTKGFTDESTEPADAGDPVTRTPDLQPLGGLREDPGRGNHQGACL